ncbi:MAG TPA: histidine utilization repressor [Caldimonas sp.]|nr:histidine utilization repressor [Caldimonas sp.]
MVSPQAAAPYAQVKHFLKEQLARGRWSPGERMPSEAQLVGRFRVSRMTVNRALRELRDEGLVERVQGVGTFAAQPGRVASTLTIRDLHAEIASRGHRHHAEVHVARREVAPPALAAKLALEAGAPVFHTVIVHHENGVPLQCEDRYVSPVCAPDYLGVDFTRTTPTHYLLEVAPIWQANYTIEAAAASAEEARLLAIERGDPCLVVVRRTANRERPITIARLVHPGSRYAIEGAFAP